MRLIVCLILVLAAFGPALAKKSEYWWKLFPNFNENGSSKSDNFNSSRLEIQRFSNGDQTSSSGLVWNVDTQPDLNDSNSSEVERSSEGSDVIDKAERFARNDDIEIAVETSEAISSEDKDETLNWTKDNDSGEEKSQVNDNKTAATSDGDDQQMTKVDSLVEEKEDGSLLENDQTPDEANEDEELDRTPNLEEQGNDDDESALVGNDENDDKEGDQAIHVNGDSHPSSKLVEQEDLANSYTDQEHDEDSSEVEKESDIEPTPKASDEKLNWNDEQENPNKSKSKEESGEEPNDDGVSSSEILEEILVDETGKERDQAIHVDGDAHPSSKLIVEEDLEHADPVPDDDNSEVEKEMDLASTSIVNDEELNWGDQQENSNQSKEESGEASRENDDENIGLARSGGMLANVLVDGKLDDGSVEEPMNTENKSKEFSIDDENSLPVEDAEAKSNEDNESNEVDNKDELIPVDEVNSDSSLSWIQEEPPKMTDETVEDLLEQSDNLNVAENLPVIPVVPKFETPACDFDKTPFTLKLAPAVSSQLEGIDVELTCQFVPLNDSLPLPQFRLTWTYTKQNCSTDDKNKDDCVKVLTSMNYESSDVSPSLSYNLHKLNQTSHAGMYTCEAEIYSCYSKNSTVTRASAKVYVKVYAKPNYALHIGILSAACVLLLVLLASLVVFTRKIQKRSKNRYQELLSTTNIEYLPTKVLELPNSVYNPTTTRFVRMSASTYSSKSSFTSNEEEA